MSHPEAPGNGRLGAQCVDGGGRVQAEIVANYQLPANHRRMVMRAPDITRAAQPGQFLHIWCHSPEELEDPPCSALLRRPYSISRCLPEGRLEILLRVRGKGGRILAAKEPGDTLDIIGPLGHGFEIADSLHLAVIIVGGVGVAPVPFLVETLTKRGIRVILLAGAENDEKFPFRIDRSRTGRATLPDIAELGVEVTFISEAVEGILVTEVAELQLGDFPLEGTELFAIGPRTMLKRLAEITGAHCRLQVSLEERMACGLGACRSCVIPIRVGRIRSYKTACHDGPIFLANEIDWERLEP